MSCRGITLIAICFKVFNPWLKMSWKFVRFLGVVVTIFILIVSVNKILNLDLKIHGVRQNRGVKLYRIFCPRRQGLGQTLMTKKSVQGKDEALESENLCNGG